MAFKPPIPTAELREIGARNNTADIKRLLWEIKRLRSIALRANQVLRAMPEAPVGPIEIIARCLLDELKAEPCVIDEDQRRIDTQS